MALGGILGGYLFGSNVIDIAEGKADWGDYFYLSLGITGVVAGVRSGLRLWKGLEDKL